MSSNLYSQVLAQHYGFVQTSETKFGRSNRFRDYNNFKNSKKLINFLKFAKALPIVT